MRRASHRQIRCQGVNLKSKAVVQFQISLSSSSTSHIIICTLVIPEMRKWFAHPEATHLLQEILEKGSLTHFLRPSTCIKNMFIQEPLMGAHWTNEDIKQLLATPFLLENYKTKRKESYSLLGTDKNQEYVCSGSYKSLQGYRRWWTRLAHWCQIIHWSLKVSFNNRQNNYKKFQFFSF